MKKIIIFLQGTNEPENKTRFSRFFNLLENRGYNIIYFPCNYRLPENKLDFDKKSNLMILKSHIIMLISQYSIKNKNIILIGHSFGGLILNSILNEYKFKNIEKIITIASFHRLKPTLISRIRLLIKKKKNSFTEIKNKLTIRKEFREQLNYKDISLDYKNKCYTIGFTLDPIVPEDSSHMKYSKHKKIMADHGFFLRHDTSLINEILDFCEL